MYHPTHAMSFLLSIDGARWKARRSISWKARESRNWWWEEDKQALPPSDDALHICTVGSQPSLFGFCPPPSTASTWNGCPQMKAQNLRNSNRIRHSHNAKGKEPRVPKIAQLHFACCPPHSNQSCLRTHGAKLKAHQLTSSPAHQLRPSRLSHHRQQMSSSLNGSADGGTSNKR